MKEEEDFSVHLELSLCSRRQKFIVMWMVSVGRREQGEALMMYHLYWVKRATAEGRTFIWRQGLGSKHRADADSHSTMTVILGAVGVKYAARCCPTV